VVTALAGRDVLDGQLPPEARNTYLVGENLKGVVPGVLDPGTYYLNPYLYNVVDVTLQSQRFVLGGEDAIRFSTLDGFNVQVEGTLEFSIERNLAEVITSQVRAFKTGMNLARYAFYQKLGPRIVSLLSSDAPDRFGGLFQPYLPKEAKP
jgi:hypothetical protein